MDAEKDIAFEIGRFYYGIRDYTNALKYYKISTQDIGPHHVTFHNQGLCHYSKGDLQEALENFAKSQEMNADYEKARNWYEKVSKELNPPPSKEEGDATVADVPPPVPEGTGATPPAQGE